jgi:hypothetical protein
MSHWPPGQALRAVIPPRVADNQLLLQPWACTHHVAGTPCSLGSILTAFGSYLVCSVTYDDAGLESKLCIVLLRASRVSPQPQQKSTWSLSATEPAAYSDAYIVRGP